MATGREGKEMDRRDENWRWADGDGYGSYAVGDIERGCVAPEGYLNEAGDCDAEAGPGLGAWPGPGYVYMGSVAKSMFQFSGGDASPHPKCSHRGPYLSGQYLTGDKDLPEEIT